MHHFLATAILIFSTAASAAGVSARRAPNADYRLYLHSGKIERQKPADDSSPPAPPTAVDAAVPLEKLDLQSLPKWDSLETLQLAFEMIRDFRFLNGISHPGFLRRDTWLYPDDGCYARAALAKQNLQDWGFPSVKKLFAFGNLHVMTKNSPDGAVNWWYHVVDAVLVNNRPYVLDPSIDPLRPLTLNEWRRQLGDQKTAITFAICSHNTYTPYDTCATPYPGDDSTALLDQLGFLDSEWDRLVALQRDPNFELGNQPPWPLRVQK